MAPAGYGNKQYQVSIGEELGDRKSLSGGTVTTNTVTGLSGLTNRKYSGQVARVLSDTAAILGHTYHLDNNSTTVLTFQENVATATLDSGDVLFLGNRNSRETVCTRALKIGEDFTPASGERDLYSGYYAGTGNQPTEIVHYKWAFDGSLPIVPHDLSWLYLIFGHEYTTGTDSGTGGSTLAEATQIGETVFDVVSATGYAADDYIQVDVTTTAEIRQITDVTSNTITVDRPLRIAHASGVACNEVTSDFAHNFAFSDTSPLPSYCLESVSKALSPSLVYRNPGLRIESWDVSATSDGPLGVTLGYKSCDYSALEDDGSTALAASSVTYTGVDSPYIHKPGNTALAINGISYAQVQRWKWTGKRALKTEWMDYEDTTGECHFRDSTKPYDHYPGNIENTLELEILVTNKNLYNLVANDTSFTVTIPVSHPADGTLTNNFTLTFASCKAPSAMQKFSSKDGPSFYTFKATAGTVTCVGNDRTPYYLMGGLST